MIVCKFGGSATASKTAVDNLKKLKNDERIIWVFSAIGKEFDGDVKLTDLLIAYTRKNSNKTKIKQQIKNKFTRLKKNTNVDVDTDKFIDEYCNKFDNDYNKDYFISRGEYLTSLIMSKYLDIKFVSAEKIIFSKNNKINYEKTEKMLKKYIFKYKKLIIPGFFACNENILLKSNTDLTPLNINQNTLENSSNNIKLFSRGGSDFSACVLAKCLGASVCEIWTDVDGIYPINPKICKTKIIENLSYNDLHIMTQNDANVIHKDCAKLLNGTDTKLIVKNIFNLNCFGSSVSSTCQKETNFLVFKQTAGLTKFILKLNSDHIITFTAPKNEFKNAVNMLKLIKNRLHF